MKGFFNRSFHTYAAWWVDANTVEYYLDDEYKFTIYPKTNFSATPFSRPMHVNMVTETYDWEKPPTLEALTNPAINTVRYDWVRAYELVKNDAPPQPASAPGNSPASTRRPHPASDPSNAGGWKLVTALSDEFDATAVDATKWSKNMQPWGDRAWSSDNVFQKDGVLHVRATYDPHTNKGEQFFYKLGILQSLRKTTYGYFEARIKGCSRFPGLCPGFWLYSNGKDLNPAYPKVTYSEIDIVEMLQGEYLPELKRRAAVNHIDCNLHCRIIDENGKEVWRRPNSLPDVCRHFWTAP